MYAKSSVTVRDLPSTDGKKLGSLSTNQGVAVTGQCNETGWYRIEYNGSTGYVSNKYLSDEQATAQNTTNGDTSNGASGSTPGTDTGATNAGGASTSTNANGLDRSTAEAVWAKVNAERSAAGLSTLAWDETAYSFACSRAQQIVSDFSHDGNTDYYGENIYNGSNGADRIHQAWHNSTGHYNNYMNTMYTAGACAVYLVDGYAYAVETFVPSWYSGNSSSTDTQTDDSSEETTNSDDSASTYPTWTASNGVVLTLYGNRCTGANSADTDAVSAAYDEWIAAGAPGDYTK
jgi:uncharacterized protein YkwD